ncbi:MAG: hypothetical protein RL077_6133 [Verrucomicrobiota bacterium]|jgi:phenylacetate-CoA ligase
MLMGDQEQTQLAALNRLIAAIAPTNRFYREKLATAAGLNGFASLADFRERMPFTTKADLVRDQADYPPHGSTLTYPDTSYIRFHQTSGTGGRPLLWLDDAASWQWVLDNWKIVWQHAGAQAGDAAFFAFSFGPFLGFWAAFDSAVQLGLRAIPAGGLSSRDRLHFLLARRPRFLCCTPTYALRLAEVARQESIDLTDSGLARIIVGGEPGGSVPSVRAQIESAWPGARVVDHHGMTEIGPVSYSLPAESTVLRLIHEAYFCEVLTPETNQPVPLGETGELVLTTLGRTACPLLRYRTGDIVRPVATIDAPATAFSLAGGILGRVDDMLVIRGVNVYPSAIDAVVRAVPGIGEYIVEIDRRSAIPEVVVRIESTSLDDPVNELAKQLRATLRIRIAVKKVPSGTLPVSEMKARRWQFLSATALP